MPAGRWGRLGGYLTQMAFIILDELGYLPFAQAGGQLLLSIGPMIAGESQALSWQLQESNYASRALAERSGAGRVG